MIKLCLQIMLLSLSTLKSLLKFHIVLKNDEHFHGVGMGSRPILPIEGTLNTNTMLNFDSSYDRVGHGEVTCKQNLSGHATD